MRDERRDRTVQSEPAVQDDASSGLRRIPAHDRGRPAEDVRDVGACGVVRSEVHDAARERVGRRGGGNEAISVDPDVSGRRRGHVGLERPVEVRGHWRCECPPCRVRRLSPEAGAAAIAIAVGAMTNRARQRPTVGRLTHDERELRSGDDRRWILKVEGVESRRVDRSVDQQARSHDAVGYSP